MGVRNRLASGSPVLQSGKNCNYISHSPDLNTLFHRLTFPNWSSNSDHAHLALPSEFKPLVLHMACHLQLEPINNAL